MQATVTRLTPSATEGCCAMTLAPESWRRQCIDRDLKSPLLIAVTSDRDEGDFKIRTIRCDNGQPVPTKLPDSIEEEAWTIPRGLAVDADGKIYFSHYAQIRTVTPDGTIGILAGKFGECGSVVGTGGADGTARFMEPCGIAFDSKDRLLVCDCRANMVRIITLDDDDRGTPFVWILAGSGHYEVEDGMGSVARLQSPRAIAIDGKDNAYVSDEDSSFLRKITPEGKVSTIKFFNYFCMSPTQLVVDRVNSVLYLDDGDRVGSINLIDGSLGLVKYTATDAGQDATPPTGLILARSASAANGTDGATLIASNCNGIIRIVLPTREGLISGIQKSCPTLQNFPPGLIPVIADYLSGPNSSI